MEYTELTTSGVFCFPTHDTLGPFRDLRVNHNPNKYPLCIHVAFAVPSEGSEHTPHDTGHRGGGGRNARDPATVFNLKLCSLVVSAIRTTLAPAVPSGPGPGDASEVVLVPLLVFREGGGSGAADAGDLEEQNAPLVLNDVIDIAQVSTAVNAMALPQQEIVVVGAVHSLSEHPQVHPLPLSLLAEGISMIAVAIIFKEIILN